MRNVGPKIETQQSYARPSLSWALHMSWHDLLFAHWPIEAGVLGRLIPDGLELETYNETAWIGVTPFWMSDVRPAAMPEGLGGRFEEINVRTYVNDGVKSGVWFFSLDAASRLAVIGARLEYGLRYFVADAVCRQEGSWIEYISRRTGTDVAFRGRYRPVGASLRPIPGSLEHFLTERYCLYSQGRDRQLYCTDIEHIPWTVWQAEAEIELNTMTLPLGVELPATCPHMLYGESREVVAGLPKPVRGRVGRRGGTCDI